MEEKLGSFILQEVIGQGGMGKVYKAFDPINQRVVALKVMKDTLLNNPKAKTRFLQEAYIQSNLSHPAIIPMHGLENHKDGLGYSMPYLEGSTLKTFLFELKKNPNLMPLSKRLNHFYKILEAVEYTHEKGFIHRDIKSDNIFMGIHDDCYLFDWGLAFKIGEPVLDEIEDFHEDGLTRPGKVPGTLTHLAPERALGIKGSIQTDIFSLGVVLYQLLTLRMPFLRKDLKHFKQVAGTETFELPSNINLKDDIDEALDLIVIRALHNDPHKRYRSITDFKSDLNNVLKGLPIWKDPQNLDIKVQNHWMFQDLLPLGSYLALCQKSLSWGLLSVPNCELVDNYKIQMEAIPSSAFKVYLNLTKDKHGFCFDHSIIIHVDPKRGTSLNRSFALIEEKLEPLESSRPINLTISKIENHFYVHLNQKLIFDFTYQVPSICPYIGLVIENTEFEFTSINLYKTSSSKQISCLKLGDTLALHGHFLQARSEYEKILESFQDHLEGGEALFRIGYSYILEAKQNKSKKKALLYKGIDAFERFKTHKASPWEYWGKALCYEALGEKKEMIKCFELGFRRFPNHVFNQQLKQELVVLFSQKSTKAKHEALMLAFVALAYLDDDAFLLKYPTLIDSLEEELKDIFILFETELTKKHKLLFALGFVLKQKNYFEELIAKSGDPVLKQNALIMCAHLNNKSFTKKFSKQMSQKLNFIDLYDANLISSKPHVLLAQKALGIFRKLPKPAHKPLFAEQAFLEGLNQVINKLPLENVDLLSSYDEKILKILEKANRGSKEHIKHLFKDPFFQESERFIRSNFIISLIDKKPIDYFGYDKAVLEFAIKALF